MNLQKIYTALLRPCGLKGKRAFLVGGCSSAATPLRPLSCCHCQQFVSCRFNIIHCGDLSADLPGFGSDFLVNQDAFDGIVQRRGITVENG